jgi:hypothetical protein
MRNRSRRVSRTRSLFDACLDPAYSRQRALGRRLRRTVADTGVSARSVNRAREIVCAAFNYGMKPTTYSLR